MNAIGVFCEECLSCWSIPPLFRWCAAGGSGFGRGRVPNCSEGWFHRFGGIRDRDWCRGIGCWWLMEENASKSFRPLLCLRGSVASGLWGRPNLTIWWGSCQWYYWVRTIDGASTSSVRWSASQFFLCFEPKFSTNFRCSPPKVSSFLLSKIWLLLISSLDWFLQVNSLWFVKSLVWSRTIAPKVPHSAWSFASPKWKVQTKSCIIAYILDSHIYDCLLLPHLIAYLFISHTLTVYLQ